MFSRRQRHWRGYPTVRYRVGTRVPETVQLYALPQEVAVDVPAIRTDKYMILNDRAGPFFFSASNLP